MLFRGTVIRKQNKNLEEKKENNHEDDAFSKQIHKLEA